MNKAALTPKQRTVAALNRCIEVCMDGQKGYAIAAADVRDATLKSVMRNYEAERATFVSTLQSAIDTLGAFHENHGTLSGSVHRAWMEARRDIDLRADETILDECVRGETSALGTYDAVITELKDAPEWVFAMLAFERNAIAIALDDMKQRLGCPTGAPIEKSRGARS